MADFGGLKAVQSSAGDPHVFAQTVARTAQALLELWNGPTSADRVRRIMDDGQEQAQDGSAAKPPYSFESDPDTGAYLAAVGALMLAAAGTDALRIESAAVKPLVQLLALTTGGAAAPDISFDGDPDTGVFRQAANAMGLAAGGSEVARIETGLLRILGQAVSVRHDNGTSEAVDWNDGNTVKIDLDANKTVTLANPVAGGFYTLELIQDATGGRTITWPANVKGEDGASPPQPDTTADRTTFISLAFNGTNYLAVDSGSGDI